MRTLLFLLIVVAVGVAFYLDWFRFSVRKDPEDEKKTDLTLRVNPEKIKEDTEAAKQKLKQSGEKAKENAAALQTQTAKGKVTQVAEEHQQFTLTTAENKDLSIQVNASTKLQLKNGEITLKDLRPGDQVLVVYVVSDGKNVAQVVTVERAA